MDSIRQDEALLLTSDLPAGLIPSETVPDCASTILEHPTTTLADFTDCDININGHRRGKVRNVLGDALKACAIDFDDLTFSEAPTMQPVHFNDVFQDLSFSFVHDTQEINHEFQEKMQKDVFYQKRFEELHRESVAWNEERQTLETLVSSLKQQLGTFKDKAEHFEMLLKKGAKKTERVMKVAKQGDEVQDKKKKEKPSTTARPADSKSNQQAIPEPVLNPSKCASQTAQKALSAPTKSLRPEPVVSKASKPKLTREQLKSKVRNPPHPSEVIGFMDKDNVISPIKKYVAPKSSRLRQAAISHPATLGHGTVASSNDNELNVALERQQCRSKEVGLLDKENVISSIPESVAATSSRQGQASARGEANFVLRRQQAAIVTVPKQQSIDEWCIGKDDCPEEACPWCKEMVHGAISYALRYQHVTKHCQSRYEHVGVSYFNCSFCGEGFLCRTLRKDHKKREHTDPPLAVKRPANDDDVFFDASKPASKKRKKC